MIYDSRFKIQENGQAALIAVILMLVIMLSAVFGTTAIALKEAKVAEENKKSRLSFFSAEAGIEDAIYRLKSGKNLGASYTISLNGASADVNVNTVSSAETQVTATGDISGAMRALFAKIITSTETINFFYGVQVGDGGLDMDNNARVIGNVYSNGSIEGDNGAIVTGDVIVAGGINADPSVEWTTHNSDHAFATASSNRDIAQSFTSNATDKLNRVSVYLGKVGSPSGNITLKIATDNSGKPSTSNIASASIANALIGATPSWINVSFSSPPNLTNGTKYWIVLDYGSNSATNYWNWRKDDSDAYANNTGKYTSNCCSGSPTWTSVGGDLAFKAWIGGVQNKIEDLTIGDAGSGAGYANLFVDTTVHGSSCPNQYCVIDSPPREEMPISAGVIETWRSGATAGGIINGNCGDGGVAECIIEDDATLYLGPKKINGNLVLTKKQKLIVTGTLYLTGYLDIDSSSGAEIKCDPSYAASSCVVVADSWVHIQNNVIFGGSGVTGSFIMILSSLAGCNGGGATSPCTHHNGAMDLHNNASGAIFYASDSMIHLHNGVNATEIVAYKLELDQVATITYDQGLANALFSSGPSGGWDITNWEEIIP